MLLPEELHFPVERCGAYRRVGFIEGVHCKLGKDTHYVLKQMHCVHMVLECRNHT